MNLRVIKSPAEMRAYSDSLRAARKTIGLVPTMGFLHEGHLSLVRKSNELADITIVSIFVNPTQFAPGEDLDSYPRDFVRDRELLVRNNTDAIFYPEPKDIYGKNYKTAVNTSGITNLFEGSTRPTHFQGVTTIVSILFNIIKPHIAIFGQKDAQQAAVIKRMTEDLHFGIDINIHPIVRENDGLAMSSRNIYLSKSEREDALVLSKSIQRAEELIREKVSGVEHIIGEMRKIVHSVKSSDLDYISFVESDSFEKVNNLVEGKEYYILIACRIGKTRLIDNSLFTF